MATTHHAEHVGSLLRPAELRKARRARAQGDIDIARLRELEGQAALTAIELQRDAGIEVFTDGEMRRENWMAGLLENLGGVVDVTSPATRVPWHRDGGPDPDTAET